MDRFFVSIYGWFSFLFGEDTWNYMSGWNCIDMEYNNQNLCIVFGVVLIISSAVISAVYYYVINHPRWAKLWVWLLFGACMSLIESIFPYWWLYDDVSKGQIGDCMIVGYGNCFGVYVANSLLFILFYAIVSVIIKWRSTSCKKTPF